MIPVPPDSGESDGKSEAEWLGEIADLAEGFVGNTIETIGSIQLLVPEAEQSETHRERMAEVMERIETLEALLIECRELAAAASGQE